MNDLENLNTDDFPNYQKYQEVYGPDYYPGHGYKGDGKRGCDVNIGSAENPQRCGAGMVQHMWVTEFYGDSDD